MKKHLRFLTLALLAFTANSVFAANEVGSKFSITKANGTKFAVEVLTVCEFEEDGTTVAKNGTVKLYRFTQNEDAPATSISLVSFKVSSGTYDIVEIGDNVFMNQTDITKITRAGALERLAKALLKAALIWRHSPKEMLVQNLRPLVTMLFAGVRNCISWEILRIK